ncbi:ASCH domain-containing protein [Micromonospora kangleipakensis]|uniref:ASCH domain-containing protein n=1 Tax=Micromonospora kangleipakensis TaxID=1077942 RepID=A0A4Q8B4B9_9ACTN|nr:ASCH domain-containing protein [Micromonospora kangleipakensis]
MGLDDLPRAEFAFPGPLRDKLVTAILSGAKTSTSALVLGYERAKEPLPEVGQRSAVVDSEDRPVAVIELTEVRVVRLADVDLQHALDEGEGDESVAQWRAGHETFWHSAEVRAELGDPASPSMTTRSCWPSASGWCMASKLPAGGVRFPDG